MQKKKKALFFVLYGASGSGKSTLLKKIVGIKGVSIHRKDTTRMPRSREDPEGTFELRFLKKLDKKDYTLVYKQYGDYYGIRRDLIDDAICKGELHFVIINDVKTIKRFKNKIPNTIVVYVHFDPSEIAKRFKKRGVKEFRKRENSIKKQYLDFIKNSALFDRAIISFDDRGYSERQMINMVNYYKKKNN